MSVSPNELLGRVFKSGDTVLASGSYMLVSDDPKQDQRVIHARVYHFDKGAVLPAHPDTNTTTDWRYMRVTREEREPAATAEWEVSPPKDEG